MNISMTTLFSLVLSCLVVLPAARTNAQSQPEVGSTEIKISGLNYVNDKSIAAQSDGMIVYLEADEGSRIKKDELLFQLDTRLVDSEIRVAEQEVLAAKEKAEDESNIKFAREKLKLAEVEFQMNQQLVGKGAASEMETLAKKLEKTQAELGVDVAEVERRRDTAAFYIAKAKYQAAETQRDLRFVKSPIDGLVIERRFEQFEWVRSGEEVLRVVNLNKIRAKFLVPSSMLTGPAYALAGADAVITVVVYPGTATSQAQTVSVNAKIGFVAPVQESDGSYRAWAEFENIVENDIPVIRNGMNATIKINSPFIQAAPNSRTFRPNFDR